MKLNVAYAGPHKEALKRLWPLMVQELRMPKTDTVVHVVWRKPDVSEFTSLTAGFTVRANIEAVPTAKPDDLVVVLLDYTALLGLADKEPIWPSIFVGELVRIRDMIRT